MKAGEVLFLHGSIRSLPMVLAVDVTRRAVRPTARILAVDDLSSDVLEEGHC